MVDSVLEVQNIKLPDSGGTTGADVFTSTGNVPTIASGVVFPAGGTGNPISVAIICDQKASVSNSGTFTASAWQTRDLNTEISDPNGIVSIASNQFTLQAGTYLIEWSCPAYLVNRHTAKLYSVTDSADLALGSSENAFVQDRSFGACLHTASGSHTYEIRHYCQTTQATNGFGIDGQTGSFSIYAIVKISKLK